MFTTLSSLRAQCDLRESAARGNLGTVGHFNTLTRFLADLASTPILTSLIQESAAPMRMIKNGQYAIDSTGFSTVRCDRWFDQKHHGVLDSFGVEAFIPFKVNAVVTPRPRYGRATSANSRSTKSGSSRTTIAGRTSRRSST